MADTRYLKTEVESYIRSRLAGEFKVSFASRDVALRTGGIHEFDAVAADDSVIGAIKTAGGPTSSGGNPSGKIKDCEAELYCLTLVEASTKLLILTSPPFYRVLTNRLRDRLADGIQLKLIELPPAMQAEVERIQGRASGEVSPGATGR